MIAGTVVAWWGAISGTVGTGLGIWIFWRDRPRIKVSLRKDMMFSANDMTNNPKEKFILITAANMGRHPVHLCKAYFTLRSSTKSLLLTGPRNLCTEVLDPGLHRDFPLIQSKCDLSDLKKAYVVDAVDRKFKCKVPRSWRKKAVRNPG